MKMSAICLFIVVLPFCVPAQKDVHPRIDSLTRLLNDPYMKVDSHKVMVLTELCRIYSPVDYGKGIPFGDQALTLAEEIHWKPGIAAAEQALATCYCGKSNYIYALDLAQKSLGIRQEARDQQGIRACLITIGVISYAEMQYEKALDYFKRALQLDRKDGHVWENVAMTYDVMNEHGQAAEYFRKAIDLFLRQGEAVKASHSLNDMGYSLVLQGRYSEADTTIRQGLRLAQQQNDTAGIELGFERLGILERAKGRYLQALAMMKKAHALVIAIGDQGWIASNDDVIGETYLLIAKGQQGWNADTLQRKRALEMAVDYLRQAVAIARTQSTWNAQLGYEKDLCEASILDDRRQEAVRALEQYAAFSDSLFNKETQRKFMENLLAYDFNRQRDSISHAATLERLRRKQDLLYTILALVVVSLVALGLIFMNRLQRLQLKSRLNNVTLAALRSQMNPHFIFNCLNSIKLYTEQNNGAAASAYLTKFSRLIRVMLQNSRSESIPLSSELELLRLYLEMEGLRFKDKLSFNIDVDPDVSVDFIEIPSMLIQPYVENAIWHGLMHKEAGGYVHIRIGEVREKSMLFIIVEDNGIGRAAAQALRSKTATQHKSFGMKLADERIRLVNEKYKTHAAVVITDLFDPGGQPSGTQVTINIPLT